MNEIKNATRIAAQVLLQLRAICRNGRSEECERGQCPCQARATSIVKTVKDGLR